MAATAEKKAVSGAQSFRNAMAKKLDQPKTIAFVAKETGKEFTEAKYKWYKDLYDDGKLGGPPAEALKKKLAKKAK